MLFNLRDVLGILRFSFFCQSVCVARLKDVNCVTKKNKFANTNQANTARITERMQEIVWLYSKTDTPFFL
jgi:hypothetical protein